MIIKNILLALICACSCSAFGKPANVGIISEADHDKSQQNDFVNVTYTKQIDKDQIVYKYLVNNIGDVNIGRIFIGSESKQIGCEVPTANIIKIETSSPDWLAELTRQEENPNKCISVEDLHNVYSIEPRQNLTVSVYLRKDDPAFEKLHWSIIFRRAPTRLDGVIGLGDVSEYN